MRILEDYETPNSRRVRMFLREKGLDLPFDQANVRQEDLEGSEFSEIHDLLTVPSLILENDTRVHEVSAICRYLEEHKPDPILLGSGASDKAHIEMWNLRLENYLFDFIYENRRFEIPGWGEINRPKAEEAFAILDEQLGNSKFVAGDVFSLADISAYIAVDVLTRQNIIPSSDLLAINEWSRQVSLRGSLRMHDQQEQLCSA